MTSQPDTFQRVTVAEAATTLGVSPATIRRMVKAGKLTGERVLRPQGSAFVVLLPRDASTPADDASDTRHDSWRVERSNASPDASQGAQETALAAWVVTLMAPLAEANARQHDVIVSQADRIADLARENGTLAERMAGLERVRDAAIAHANELEQKLEAAARPLDPEPAPDPCPAPIPPVPNAAPRWRRRWLAFPTLALTVLAALLLLAVAAPAWVR